MPAHEDSSELSPGCRGSVGWQVLGGVRQTTLCPTGTNLPCHRLPKGAASLPPYSSPPWCCYGTPSQLHLCPGNPGPASWVTLLPPAPTALAPAQTTQ